MPVPSRSSAVLDGERREDGSADHDVGEAVGISGSEALGVAFCAFLIIGRVGCLVESGKGRGCEDVDGIDGGAERELVLELCAVSGAGLGV